MSESNEFSIPENRHATMADDGLARGPDGRPRCWWPGADPLYLAYHDEEWGIPQGDDRRLFEKLCLEGFQSGLSWLTILRKRPAFREVFLDFDYRALAAFGPDDVERLLGDARIVRHRGKIASVLNNARHACALADETGSLAAFLWRFAPPPRRHPLNRAAARALTRSPESEALSRELKRRGWSFVGPTTLYAFMQAVGMVNVHLAGCCAEPAAAAARRRFPCPARDAAARP
jgi:DNA-3-methyladenine glycosylase I